MASLDLIIPCYNEEEVLPLFYSAMQKTIESMNDCGVRLIFVDDGSRDGTLRLLRSFASENEQVKYISFSRNFGKEAAMLAGMRMSSAEYVGIIDADLQHSPDLIPQMLHALTDEDYDIAAAKRVDRKGEGKVISGFSALFYKMINRISDADIEDGAQDFRIMKHKVVDAILDMPEYNRFSKGLFSWIGFKQTFIRYENHVREGGTSKWSVKRLLRYGIDGIMSFNDKPLRICFWMGGLLFTFGVLYLTVIFIRILLHGVDVPGYFTTIFAILMIGGVQLLSIGVLGEYIGRIYHEVKRRPPFIVDKTNIKDKGKRS